MSEEAEKNKKLRLEIVNDFEKLLQERLELGKQTFRDLRLLVAEYAKKDARIVGKLEKIDEKGSHEGLFYISFPDPFIHDETLESIEGHIDDLKENLDVVAEVQEQVDELYKEENEEEEDEDSEGDDQGEDDENEEEQGEEE